ncbi:MAG: glycosyltransferase family 4 protein [Thermoleophilaceae bacterium]
MRITFVAGDMDAARDGVAHYVSKLVPRLRGRGIGVDVLSRPPGGWNARAVAGLARALRRRSPDVVHLQYSPTAYDYARWLGALPLALGARAPLVLTVHEFGWWPWHAPLPEPLRSWIPRAGEPLRAWDRESLFLVPRASAVMTSSDTLGGLLEERFGERPRAVPVGANIERVAADRAGVRERLGIPEDAPVVAFFGFVRPDKGVRTLLDAMARIREARPDARLLVIGGFENIVSSAEETAAFERELRSAADGLGLDGHVTFTGHVGDREVSEMLAAADAGALPFDGGVTAKSGSLLAQLAHELPTVVTRPDGPDWLVEDGATVMTVEPRDSEALASAIGSLLEQPDEAARLAREGRTRAERAGWDAVVDAHLAVYEQVLDGG